ncbi:MAG: hypothetical protein FIB01_11320 [Gemmatimonadetes bacterium]|nr:hypothetical protein [Gemmatimonadota bacterium]
MPSEDRTLAVLKVLEPARAAFHGALVAAVEELRGYIATHRQVPDIGKAAAASLGQFAAGRIDAERFGALFAHDGRLPPEELDRLEQALEGLADFARQGDELYRIRVAPGADLRDTVRGALAARGRAFAVARGAEAIRSGRGEAVATDEQSNFPFRQWHRAERQIAPPLVLEVEGGDLHVGGLAEYLDGRFKLVLLVAPPAPAAPLTRLIGPHVFVQQTTDPAALRRLVAFDGPGIAAVVPGGCACFTWDPSAGPRFEQRLQVELVPGDDPQQAIGSDGVAQQQADLQWLHELSELRARALAGGVAASGDAVLGDPADLFAAWLLRQTSLEGV